MQPSQWEVIILKPTRVFAAFLQAQLPEGTAMPDLKLLQTDNTAYVIQKQADEEATLDEIEKHYTTMFRNEIVRWLGIDASYDIKGTFLDFLCCFKFELHQHIVLMEDKMSDGHQLLRVKPKSVLLKWMRETVEEDELVEILDKVTVSQIAENATVIVKNFNQLDAIRPFMELAYQPIFEAEMQRMSDAPNTWPAIHSLKDFSRYFAIEIHTRVVHLH